MLYCQEFFLFCSWRSWRDGSSHFIDD